MSQQPFPAHHYPDDVAVLRCQDKTILIVGTAHISQQSTDLVRTLITQEEADTVCIELDEKRYTALAKRQNWENLDLKQVIRNKQLATLLVNLILAAYQKKLGGQMGVAPGTELLTAAQCAEKKGIPIQLCDRDVRTTLRRAWHATSFFKKGLLLATLLGSLFDRTELDEEQLAAMRRRDVLSELINELGQELPHTKEVLIDERDIYMAEKIKSAPGQRIIAVVGAGHMEGIQERLNQNNAEQVLRIEEVPPPRPIWKMLGWLIPIAILVALLFTGWKHGSAELTANAVYWILANGIPSAIGALAASAHPLTILSAMAAAPITSLTPLIGAGYVCAFVQVITRPPVVKEFETIGADIGTITGWWHNKLLRVFLVFLLTGFGSMLGTWVGGYRIFHSLLA